MKNNKYFLIGVSLIFILLTSIPYIYGIVNTPGDGKFTGYIKNIDDMAVYASWVKQIEMSNSPFIYNLFQDKLDAGKQINVYFMVLGYFGKIFHLAPVAVLHIFRILQSILLIYVFWMFIGLFTNNDKIKKIGLLCFLFGSGLGYFIKKGPIDIWQPEAITFMSAYLNPLFTISLALIIATYYNLIKLYNTNENKYMVFASLYFLLLGNVHTYDVVNVYAIWGVFISSVFFYNLKNSNFKAAFMKLYKHKIVFLIGLITPVINYLLYSNDIIYKSRVDTVIKTPIISDVLLGFGLLFIFSIAALFYMKKENMFSNKIMYFLVSWLVVNLITIYIPFSQQRKFIMGYEIPLAILSGFFVYYLVSNVKVEYKKWIVALIVFILFLTNISNMMTDINKLSGLKTQTIYFAYLSNGELDVLNYISKLDKNVVVWAPPQVALFVPEYANRHVYYGHWSETPNYNKKMSRYLHFISKKNKEIDGNIIIVDNSTDLTGFNLKKIYSNNEFNIYKK